MPITPEQAIMWAWVAWILSWFAAAAWSKRTEKRAGFGAEFAHMVVTVVGMLLVFSAAKSVDEPTLLARTFDAPSLQLWTTPEAIGWALTIVAIAGFAFCWWARVHLGPLWSGRVMRKADHEVIDTGPYTLVRHPIYTGLILAAVATALLKGSAVNLIGAVLVIVGLWMKARLEERFLRAELGGQAYDAYAAKVPMLMPALAGRR